MFPNDFTSSPGTDKTFLHWKWKVDSKRYTITSRKLDDLVDGINFIVNRTINGPSEHCQTIKEVNQFLEQEIYSDLKLTLAYCHYLET